MGDHPCEASLFAHIPLSRHEQVLGILAGLGAMQPVLEYTRHVLFAPIAAAERVEDGQTLQKKPRQNTSFSSGSRPQVYVQAIAAVHDDDFGRAMPLEDDDAARWTTRTQQTPDPEFSDVIVRRVDISRPDFGTMLNPVRFRFAGEYLLETQRVVVRDVVLSLRRVLVYAEGRVGNGKAADGVPELGSCRLLDASGAFAVEATVEIADRTVPALVRAAVEQLNTLKSDLRGVITLRAPERLSMDSRVKTARA